MSFSLQGTWMQKEEVKKTWSKRQIWLWSTQWSRAEASSILPRERTGHSKHRLPTTQEKTLHMDITRWSMLKSDWLYSLQAKMEKLYTVNKNKTRSWLWLRSWTPYCQIQTYVCISSVQFSRSVMSDSLQPHESQHGRPACPSPTPGVHSHSSPSSQWCHPAVSSSVIPFSSCPQSLPASVFSNELTLCMRWPKYWCFSFSIIPSKEISGLISFRMMASI